MDKLSKLVERLENIADRLETANVRDKSLKHNSNTVDNNHIAKSSIMTSLDGAVADAIEKLSIISAKISNDVKSQCDLLKEAFKAESDFIKSAGGMSKPSDSQLASLLKPCSDAISKVTEFKDQNRRSAEFNHLSAVAESVGALGWVAAPMEPSKYIDEMIESGKFYTNRILKEFKGKDEKHVEWVHALLNVWTQLKAFTSANHPAGLKWGAGGANGAPVAPPPPPGGAPPPPPPPPPGPAPGGCDPGLPDTQALFADINRGDAVMKGLRKVTNDMKTHKNPELRAAGGALSQSGSKKAPPALPPRPGAAANQPKPKIEFIGNKWLVEHHVGNHEVIIEAKEKKETLYIFKCIDSVVQVKGKINSIVLDSCKKTSLLFDSVISCVDIINCQSAQIQVTGSVATINIDKTDGCQIYLNEESKNADIITAKSSELNVLIPKSGGDYVEYAIPEQFKTNFVADHLETKVNDLA